jgi:hypothetical protein
MPYYSKGKCIYKKKSNKKVGCTKGPVENYMAALHANVEESLNLSRVGSNLEFKNVRFPSKDAAVVTFHYISKKDSIDVTLVYKSGRNAEEATYSYGVLKDLGDIHDKGIRFVNSQSKEFENFVNLKRVALSSQDIETAKQVASEKIKSHFSANPTLDEPFEESLEFESRFDALINA